MKIHLEELLLLDVIDNFPSSITVCDTNCRILWMNRRIREKRGISNEELSNQTCYGLFKGYSKPCGNCSINRVVEDGLPGETEEVFDNEFSPLEKENSWHIKLCPIKDKNDKVVGVITFAEDITEWRNTKYQLEKNREAIQNIEEASNDLIWASSSTKGVFIYVNPAVEKILGYKPEEITNRPFSQFIYPGDGGKKKIIIEAIAKKQGWSSIPVKWKHKDGSWKTLESTATPILGINGELTGYRGIDRDITEREHLMAQLMHSQKMESVGRLAGGVSHDFNNMLSVILGYSEMAFKWVDQDHPVYDHLKQIQNAAQRSASLTRQLLAFARKQVISPEVLDLNHTLESMLKLLQRLIGSDITLSWIPGEDLWPIEMDPSQIDQILANLCVNARDAINGIGKIRIQTRNQAVNREYCAELPGLVPGDYVVFSISDTGKGIDKEIITKIFEPFFTTKPGGEGTGLGLSTIYGIVKQNGGFVYAFSEAGKETRFDVYLPRYQGEMITEVNNTINREVMTGTESILLVEDEKENLTLVRLFLEDLGYKVTAESRPRKALDIYKKNPEEFQLLLTDMIMPELRGRELRNEIQKINPDIKCIFMSGYGAGSVKGRVRVMKNEPFLQKPFTQKVLAVKVREVLESDDG